MESAYYVALDIGCLECHHPTEVIGVFDSKEAALGACRAHYDHHGYETGHDIKILPVGCLNSVLPPRWRGWDTSYDMEQCGFEYVARPEDLRW